MSEQNNSTSRIITKEQYDYHYNSYYKPYHHKLREVRARLLKANMTYTNSIFSMYKILKREEAWLRNSVLLHDAYFECLKKNEGNPSPQLFNMLIRDYGSMEEWITEFSVLARYSEGWAIFGFDLSNGNLINCRCEDNYEGMWMVHPLLTLDLSEHAYQLDYGTKKGSYIKDFLENIYWPYVNGQLEIAEKTFKVRSDN
ncbi:MAG: hypothetical protein FH758_14235 [Firmicutes bacterium]|nr:hypothetical protein [Bacillota bacterium]